MTRSVFRRSTAAAVAALAVAALVTACAPAAQPAADASGGAEEPTPIRVAVTRAVPVFNAAVQEGIYAEHGFDVEVTVLASGTDTIAALVGGSVDIAYADTFAGVSAISNDFDLALLAGQNRTSYQMKYEVPADSAITSPKDLEGKKLGLVAAPYATVLAKAWLDHNGADPDEVTFVTVKEGLGEALQSGSVDAIQVSGSAGLFYQYQDQFGFEQLGDSPTAPYVSQESTQAGWFSTTTWAQDHEQLADQWAQAVYAQNEWYQGLTPQERGAFYEDVTDVDLIALDAQYPGVLEEETYADQLVTGPIDVDATLEWIEAGNRWAPDRVPSGVDFASHIFSSARS